MSTVPGSVTMFEPNTAGGSVGQFSTVQNKFRNGTAAGWNADGSLYPLSIADGGPGHRHAMRFEVRDGDVPEFGGGERSELSSSAGLVTVREGDRRVYQLSYMFDEDFATTTSSFCIVTQWHSGSGSPPLAFQVLPDDHLWLTFPADLSIPRLDLGPINRGVWTDIILRVVFSNDPTIGEVELARDGTLRVATTKVATMNSASNYFKCGIYRSAAEVDTQVLWLDRLRISSVQKAQPPIRSTPMVLVNGLWRNSAIV